MTNEKLVRSNEKMEGLTMVNTKYGNLVDFTEIVVKGQYFFDVQKSIGSLHLGTKTVEVIELTDRGMFSNPLAKVISLQTGEVFSTDIAHLQKDPEILKEKYKEAISCLMNYKNDVIYELTDSAKSTLRNCRLGEVLVVLKKGIELYTVLTDKGIITSLAKGWVKPLMKYSWEVCCCNCCSCVSKQEHVCLSCGKSYTTYECKCAAPCNCSCDCYRVVEAVEVNKDIKVTESETLTETKNQVIVTNQKVITTTTTYQKVETCVAKPIRERRKRINRRMKNRRR